MAASWIAALCHRSVAHLQVLALTLRKLRPKTRQRRRASGVPVRCSNELISSSTSPSLGSADGLRVVAVAEPLGLGA